MCAMEGFAEANRIGEVAWDGASATSERVLLRAPLTNRRFLNRNHYVRIRDEEGQRSGFLARIVAGPFFHRAGWAVAVVDVEGAYTQRALASDEAGMAERLARFGRSPEGLPDFHVFHPASCASDRETSEAFTLRLADFDTNVIGEMLQVTLPE